MYEVIQYINEHIHEKLTLSDISNKFGYSKWYFCSCFKKYTGMSFVEYINDIRMQKATIDFLNGEKVLQIALDYGYENVSGFNKAFFKKYRCSLTEFKKNYRLYQQKYDERKTMMNKLSDRCDFLREQAVNEKPYNNFIRGQYLFYSLKGIIDTPCDKCTNAILKANAISGVIRNSVPVIGQQEVIVGYNYGDGECDYLSDDEEKLRNELHLSGFNDDDIKWYIENRTKRNDKFYFERYSGADDEAGCGDVEWSKSFCCIDSNHSVIGYEKVLKLGFEGLLAETEKYEKINGESDFYDALKILCRAGCEMGIRYSEKARQMMADAEITDERKRELSDISTVCTQVPAKPARNLHEAIQSLWFAHIINTWEDGINANSLGRLDQILYPYYKKDIEHGIITKEQAFELICCLWIKLYRDYDVQQSCVGGCDADGNDAVNELSYMMLDATERLDFVRCLSVRYSKNTDKAFIKRAFEVVGHLQKGIPFFFNDDVMIPSLTTAGVELADARNYTQLGCVETVIPGKSNPHAVSGKTNLLKALEYTFGNGRSMYNPNLCPGIKTGNISDFDTYPKLEAAVKEQIKNMLDSICKHLTGSSKVISRVSARPYKSLLTEGCAESGKDFNAYGAKYDYYQVMLTGIPNLADSLAVIRKFVYETNKYTLADIYDILDSDFQNEAVRLEFLNKAPKFGNDIDEVDNIAVDILNYACDCLEEMSRKYGLQFHAQPFSYLWLVEAGQVAAASPDGRRKGEAIAYSVSPMQGRDFNGVTAVFNSIAKLPSHRTPGTTSAIIEIEPLLFSDSNIDKLVDIFVAASNKGLANVQFNTVDKETLLDAQRNPDKYKNLAVRVSGFSQKFNLLDRSIQDHIIARTKHSRL